MSHRVGRGITISTLAIAMPLGLGIAGAVSAQATTGDLPTAAAASATQSGGTVLLETEYQTQKTSYWCGPAAVRHALSARGKTPSQASLADTMGTTTAGTNSIYDIRRGLNKHVNNYAAVETPEATMPKVKKEQMWKNIKHSINRGRPVVVNIVAYPGSDAAPAHYPNRKIYHYFTVSGYDSDGTNRVRIVDSYFGKERYWLDFSKLARLTAEKGYVYYAG